MAEPRATSIVGSFLRQKREAKGLSQRGLGQLFDPKVTTQFISNIERGVTPLPPVHIPTLVRVLGLSEGELLSVLEKEYAAKISSRVGRPEQTEDRAYFQALFDAYQSLDPSRKEAFHSMCETLVQVSKASVSKLKSSG